MAGDLDLLTGTWTVKVKGWVWEYDFRGDGGVTWRDLGSMESGVGNWAATSKLVNIWWKGSTTRESWQRPLTNSNDHTWYEAPYYRGKYRIEKTGFVAPSPTPPSGPTDANLIDRAWEASRTSLRFAVNRLRLLQRQIKYFEESGGSEDAFNELRRNYRRDMAVVSRKLLVPMNPMDPAFRSALASAIRLFEQNLALPKIHAYYGQILADFSVNDVTHTLHYLLKMLENMKRLDAEWGAPEGQSPEDAEP